MITALAFVAYGLSGCSTGRDLPACGREERSIFILEAQAVPSSTQLPCIAALPPGWSYGGFAIRSGLVRLWLDSDRAGIHAVQVDLTTTCDISDAVEVPSAPDELLARSYQAPESLTPAFTGARYLVFRGGCVTYRYAFQAGAPATLTLEADGALSIIPRSVVVDRVQRDLGLSLCGAGAPPCEG